MNLTLALQHVLAIPTPRQLAGDYRFGRELRGRMRLSALRYRMALEVCDWEGATVCLATAMQWRNLALDCAALGRT